MKETHKHRNYGLCIGMCFGAAIDIAFEQDGGWSSMGFVGIALGLLVGMAIGMAMNNKVNEQLRSQGYRIKEIREPSSDGGYELIIVNHAGEEMIRTVEAGDMDVEGFKVGDMVYIDEDGAVEQAYDEDWDDDDDDDGNDNK